MISCIGKILLVATSLAPVCGAFAFNRIGELGWPGCLYDAYFWSWTVVGCSLVFITCMFLWWCQLHIKHTAVTTAKIKPTDKDVLAFLLAYLLPLLGEDSLAFDRPVIAGYVIALICLAVYHSNAYHFNPLLSMFGWHFYEIETDAGYAAMLISKSSHVTQSQSIVVAKLTDFLLLEVQDKYLKPE